MGRDLETAAWQQAERVAPEFVAAKGVPGDITVGFHGRLSPSGVNRTISFQASVRHELGLAMKASKFRNGCFEVDFELASDRHVELLFDRINERMFDGIAYRFKVIFVRAIKLTGVDEIHFDRDSVYR